MLGRCYENVCRKQDTGLTPPSTVHKLDSLYLLDCVWVGHMIITACVMQERRAAHIETQTCRAAQASHEFPLYWKSTKVQEVQ